MMFAKYTWCCFLSWLVVKTFGFDPVDFRAQGRALVRANTEIDRLRVAFVRAQEIIKRQKAEAATWPSIRAAVQCFPAAEDIGASELVAVRARHPDDIPTLPSMRSATEYMAPFPPGDGVEIPR